MNCYNKPCIGYDKTKESNCNFYDYALVGKCEKRVKIDPLLIHMSDHIKMHNSLEALFVDYKNYCKYPNFNMITQLRAWSKEQSINPDHPPVQE